MKTWILILLVALAVWSCQDNSDERTPVEFRLTVGDTTIVIPNEAVEFAGTAVTRGHFDWEAYALREYQIALDTTWRPHSPPYLGTLSEWKAQAWDIRRTFLVAPYSHDIATPDAAQYYYEIGTYFTQFGYGWKDTYPADADLTNPAAYIWLYPSDTTLAPDNTSTIGFDGESNFIHQYRALWRFE